MKKLFSYCVGAFVAMLAIGASSCSNDETVDAVSRIEVRSTMALDAAGGMATLTYTVPDSFYEGGGISVTSSVDWMHSFDTSAHGTIEFKYNRYEDDSKDRFGVLTLSYPGEVDAKVTVTQIREGGVSFEIEIAELGKNEVRASIVPSNYDVPYIAMVLSKASFDTYKESEIIADDLEFLTDYANKAYGLDIQTYLSLYAGTGPSHPEDSRYKFSSLYPDTEYYVYCYAINISTLEPLSSIYKKEFRTELVPQIDCTFKVEAVSLGSYDALITITPTGADSEDAMWSFTYLNEYAFRSNEYTDEIIRNNTLLNVRKADPKPQMYRGPLQFKLSELTGSIRVWGGTEYYLYTYAMDESYNYTTDFTRNVVKTADIEATNPCTFEVSIPSIKAKDATIHVVPSDPETTYYIGVTPTAAFKDATLSQIVERTLQRQDGWTDGNGDNSNWETNTWVMRGEQTRNLAADLNWVLLPEQELTVFVFGFDKTGHRTTAIEAKDFMTTKAFCPEDFKVEIEDIDASVLRQVSATFKPNYDDVFYYAGIVTSEWFDAYESWRDFVNEMIHADGSIESSCVVGEQQMTSFCTPGTDYVAFAFAFAGGQVLSDITIAKVTTLPLPRSDKADLTASWKIYDGTILETLYPTAYKGCSGSPVFIFWLEPNEYCAHYYGLLHAARRYMPLSDDLIYEYFDTNTLGYKDARIGRYLPPGLEYWGFFYAAQDETGAWGPMHYEEPDLREYDYSDPMTAPTQGGWSQKNPAAASVSSVKSKSMTFSAPIRFSTASFAVAEAERAAYERGPVVCRGEEHALEENDFDLNAHLAGVIEAQARMNR